MAVSSWNVSLQKSHFHLLFTSVNCIVMQFIFVNCRCRAVCVMRWGVRWYVGLIQRGERGNQHPEKKEEKQKHRKYCETDIIPIVMSGGYIGQPVRSALICSGLSRFFLVCPSLCRSAGLAILVSPTFYQWKSVKVVHFRFFWLKDFFGKIIENSRSCLEFRD